MSNDHSNLLGHALLRENTETSVHIASMMTMNNMTALDSVEEDERMVRREVTGFQDILRTHWKAGNPDVGSSGGSHSRSGNQRHLVRDSDGSLLPTMVVLASFSNFMKMDPSIVSVWGSILRRCPKAVLWLQVRRDVYRTSKRFLVPNMCPCHHQFKSFVVVFLSLFFFFFFLFKLGFVMNLHIPPVFLPLYVR
jgi:hypothetical protein